MLRAPAPYGTPFCTVGKLLINFVPARCGVQAMARCCTHNYSRCHKIPVGQLPGAQRSCRLAWPSLFMIYSRSGMVAKVAQAELDHVRRVYEGERGRRETEFREKHQVVQIRRHMKEQAER